MSLEVKRKGNPTDIESWLTRFPTLFRRGRHPATCRWCDGPLTIVSVATDEAAAWWRCGDCDEPHHPPPKK
jgi:hypothetical protein